MLVKKTKEREHFYVSPNLLFPYEHKTLKIPVFSFENTFKKIHISKMLLTGF